MGSVSSSKNDTVHINASNRKKTKRELDAEMEQWLSENSLLQYQKKLRSKKVTVDGLTSSNPTQIKKLCSKLKMDDITSTKFIEAVTKLHMKALNAKDNNRKGSDDYVVVNAPNKKTEPTLATAANNDDHKNDNDEEMDYTTRPISLLGSDSGLGLPSPKPSASPPPNHPQHTILGLMSESQQNLQPPEPEKEDKPIQPQPSAIQKDLEAKNPASSSDALVSTGSISVSEDMKLAIAMSLREYEQKTNGTASSDLPTAPAPMQKQSSYINRDSLLARQLFAEEKLDSWRELPTRVLSQQDAALLQAVEKNCVICMGEFEKGEMLRRLGVCGCEFHLECIDEYFEELESDKIVLQCPIDRSAPLSSDTVAE